MKQIEFKTSKGTFVIVDIDANVKIESIMGGFVRLRRCNKVNDYYDKTYYKLTDITEDDADKVVDKVMNGQHFQNYNYKCITDRWVKTAIESLHSLIKSLGIHLYENPIKVHTWSSENADLYIKRWRETELKTFYNPHIFKKK